MPLPLIPAIVAIATAGGVAHGAKKGIEAKQDMDRAKSINSSAKNIADRAEKSIETTKELTKKAICNLGEEKIRILSSSINDFVIYYEKIKNMTLIEGEGIDELKNFNPSSESFKKLKDVSFEAKDMAVNGVAAVGAGALLAFGTYNVVMGGLGGLLVTATTGTALSTLSGVAATNATLAWLGGGALSVGGLGIAGGTLVLGGLVIGPALAVGGSVFAKQAKTALNDAHSNMDKARTFESQARNIVLSLNNIQRRANQLKDLLKNLDKNFLIEVEKLKYIINNYGNDWRTYSIEQKEDIFRCVKYAQVIKVILDTPLLKENGELDKNSEKILKEGQNKLQELKGI